METQVTFKPDDPITHDDFLWLCALWDSTDQVTVQGKPLGQFLEDYKRDHVTGKRVSVSQLCFTELTMLLECKASQIQVVDPDDLFAVYIDIRDAELYLALSDPASPAGKRGVVQCIGLEQFLTLMADTETGAFDPRVLTRKLRAYAHNAVRNKGTTTLRSALRDIRWDPESAA